MNQEILDKSGLKQYVDKEVVKNAPILNLKKGAVIEFFSVGRYTSDDELEKEYESRGLIPADLISLTKYNIDNPKFTDNKSNGTHWKDADGKWCFATFRRWLGERDVHVRRSGSGWCDGWFFAGVRKSNLRNSKSLNSSKTLSSVLPDILVINNVEYKKI